MREWKLSFHTRSYWVHHKLDLFASVAAIKQVGFDAVEIAMPHLKSLNIATMSAGDRATFKRRFADLGIEIGSISGHSTICHEDRETREPEIAFFKRAFDFAADVGAGVVATHAMYRTHGPAGFYGPDPGESHRAFRLRSHPPVPPARRQFVLEILGECARHAESRGVIFGLEDFDPSPKQIWENMVREIDSPCLRLNLQVHHGTTPGAAARERRDIISHFHIKPPTEGAGFEGWSLGEYIDFINALDEIDFPRDYFTVEEHSELDPNVTAKQIHRYFRRLLE
jgi:sugar phosphate isomerase/epimerase